MPRNPTYPLLLVVSGLWPLLSSLWSDTGPGLDPDGATGDTGSWLDPNG
ncbi:MAG TPA: hypothetical protein VL025_04930 [Thermoanaerobaculia bacterium]|nr:hypothetical protein [Thermoanaerobaculia bacterium]